MKRFATYGLTALGLLFLTALVGAFPRFRAGAQTLIRAILVKDVDAPGRHPYTAFFDFRNDPNGTTATCDYFSISVTCTLYFDFVPSGRRLVIENVSGQVRTNSPNGVLSYVQVASTSLVGGLAPFSYLGPLVNEPRYDGKFYNFSSPVKGYVNQASQPAVTFQIVSANGSDTHFTPGASIAITGYLVDLTQ